ncbi:MAG: hypothetical protein Ta2B_05370 [Termitinemataceae bacterium]|nr:MAG: hypothetical protein Ta2B_05370 [Termitinemataceae bacterium]
MRKEKVILTILLCAFIFAFIGCATTPIEKRFPERWEKTKVGMTLEEFKTVWPEATWSGEGTDDTEVYFYSPPYIPYVSTFQKTDGEWFTFKDKKLLKWKGRLSS